MMTKHVKMLMWLLLIQLKMTKVQVNGQGITEYGRSFKGKINQLFDSEPQSELVFVLDSSDSVYEDDFYVAVGFIRSILTLISVSSRTTHVSVISYSDCDDIQTHIDYIGSPSGKNKCTFDEDMRNVIYHTGRACTSEALKVGYDVLTNGRPGALRVMILFMGGPSDAASRTYRNADKLKNAGVIIFAFGIGNIDEVNRVATNVNDYAFLLDSYGDVMKLTAIMKEDIRDYTAYFDRVSETKCNGLCDTGTNCCDGRAICACATRSGSTVCACEAGFTGTGISCTVCEIGTYKSHYGDGPCEPCPLYSTTRSTQSTERSDCYCILGYEGNPGYDGGSCQPIRCPDLDIDNMQGVIIAECDSSFGSTCQFQCRDNYRPVAGEQEITCLATRHWSVTPLQCEKITCDPLTEPFNAVYTCSTRDRSIGTVCEIICNAGYEVRTDTVTHVTCQRVSEIRARWSAYGGENPCQKVSCPPLSTRYPMRVIPFICLEVPKLNQVCSYYCINGYQAVGNVDSLTCMADGSWSVPALNITCIDKEPPRISCPEDISNPTDPGMTTSMINWKVPVATDNSFMPVKLNATHSPPYNFDIGTSVVIYTATDDLGNTANCTFNVTVRGVLNIHLDIEPPNVTCPADISSPTDHAMPTRTISWEEPVATDNSGIAVKLNATHSPPYLFSIGTTAVTYTATDATGNMANCNFTVTIRDTCQYYPPPLNGAVACCNWAGDQHCRASCRKNFHFSGVAEHLYSCTADANGLYRWSRYGDNRQPIDMPWPNCTAIREGVSGGFKFRRSCFNNNTQVKIRKNFIQVFNYLKDPWDDTHCTFEDVDVQCGQTEA